MAQLLFSLFILALFAATITTTPTSKPTPSGITTSTPTNSDDLTSAAPTTPPTSAVAATSSAFAAIITTTTSKPTPSGITTSSPTNSDDLTSAAPTTTPTSAIAATITTTISTESIGLISAAQSTTPTKTNTATSSSSAGSTITPPTLDVSVNSLPVLEALLQSHHRITSSSARVTTTTSLVPPAITTTPLHSHKVYHVFLFCLLLVTLVSLVGFFDVFFRKSDKATEQPKPSKKDKKPVPRADSSQPDNRTPPSPPFHMKCAGNFCKVISNLPKDIKLSWSEKKSRNKRGPVLDSDNIKPYFPNFEEEP